MGIDQAIFIAASLLFGRRLLASNRRFAHQLGSQPASQSAGLYAASIDSSGETFGLQPSRLRCNLARGACLG